MAKKILQFKSCAQGGEYTSWGQLSHDYSGYTCIGSNQTNTQAQIDLTYASDPLLANKVTGIGYGWQKYIVPTTGKCKVTVRGAAGGCCGYASGKIDPITGAVTGSLNRGGRGAKLVGDVVLKKDDVLYILVGMRGWCNSGGADWGAGGGGASVILRANPSGAYKFQPTNEQVDVLFVAGGGGGSFDQSFHGNYYGTDASYNNGTSTAGGSSGSATGGAGLTGNSSSGSQGSARSLLSGANQVTTPKVQKYGGWGGGGHPYDGGGGGAGYSGGSAANDRGGYGGTSYINPSLVTETFRGYATVAEDGNRNLTNPWTAYGFVEIELGRDDKKYILAEDSDGYKWFNGEINIDGTSNETFTDTWELLDNQDTPDETTFETFGKTIINNATGLQDNVKFLISSMEPEETISIDGYVNGAIVELTEDAITSDVSAYKSFTLDANLSNVDVRFAVSKDFGKTYQTYASGQWVDIDITNKAEFQNNGYELTSFTAIPATDWDTYNAKTLRFAFCISQNGNSTGALLKAISHIADLTGSWKRFTEDQATYEYISTSQVKVTFFEGGNYKVNYLDKIINT